MTLYNRLFNHPRDPLRHHVVPVSGTVLVFTVVVTLLNLDFLEMLAAALPVSVALGLALRWRDRRNNEGGDSTESTR